jgi:hypothetical protein
MTKKKLCLVTFRKKKINSVHCKKKKREINWEAPHNLVFTNNAHETRVVKIKWQLEPAKNKGPFPKDFSCNSFWSFIKAQHNGFLLHSFLLVPRERHGMIYHHAKRPVIGPLYTKTMHSCSRVLLFFPPPFSLI